LETPLRFGNTDPMKVFPRILFLSAGVISGACSTAQSAVLLTANPTAPTTGAFDQFNLAENADVPGGIFNSQAFSDNAGPPGQTFTTLAGGPFTLNAFSFKGANTGSGNLGGNVDLGTWGIRVSSVSGTTLTPLLTVTNITSPTPLVGTEWMTWTFSGADLLTLAPSTTYAVEVFSSQGYYGFDAATDANSYLGGVAFNNAGAARTFSSTTLQDRGYDRTFVASISVPEPASVIGLACGLGMLLLPRRRRSAI
jgi:hypothetical protein